MEEKNVLRAGYGKVCITPEESMPLAGYGNVMFRMSQNVLSDIYSICIALSDADDNTVLLFEPGTGEVLDIPANFENFHNIEIAEQIYNTRNNY